MAAHSSSRFEDSEQTEGTGFLDLRSWIRALEERGDLHRVNSPADIRYDIPRILEDDDGQRAVLFENVTDYAPTTVFGGSSSSRAHMAMALGVSQKDLLSCYTDAVEHPIAPVEVAPTEAPVLEVHEREVRLDRLPAPWHHEKDSGKYLTADIAIVRDPETGFQNWSIHRLQINNARQMGASIVPRHLWRIFAAAEAQDRDLPVALVIGLPPAYLLASQAVVPFGFDEAGICGALLGQPMPAVRSPRYGIMVPAMAEYLLEGRILARRREPEGPFGEFPRTYGTRGDRPVVEVDEIYHRSNAIFQTILSASKEHMLLGAIAREASIYNAVRHISPNVHDVILTFASGCRFHAVVSMTPKRKGEAKNVLLAAFAGFNEIKRVVVVDEDVDITSAEDVEWAMATRVQPPRDVVIIEGALGSSVDPSAGEGGESSKWGIDATIPVGVNRERYARIRTPRPTSSPDAE
jgi:2,5-furandicarboxylate decarboxylase 1